MIPFRSKNLFVRTSTMYYIVSAIERVEYSRDMPTLWEFSNPIWVASTGEYIHFLKDGAEKTKNCTYHILPVNKILINPDHIVDIVAYLHDIPVK